VVARFASEKLKSYEQRLETHFAGLSAARDGQTPVFALEHGLSLDEVAELQHEVRLVVRERGGGLLTTPLAFVVHATELGYEYAGDEYWDSFAKATPGWPERQAAEWLVKRFQEFADTYGGIRIGGVWARHFNRIAWPITHAVLPKDLQRDVLELMYQARGSFSRETLESPSTLGALLSGRAMGSSRFMRFVENHELLGLVASALLGEEAGSEIMLSSTLNRIASDLTREREAQDRLRDVRRKSAAVRTVGFAPRPSPAEPFLPSQPLRVQRQNRVRARMEGTPAGWRMVVRIPNLVEAVAATGEVRQALIESRYRVAGRSSWLSRRTLTGPGKSVVLDSWPLGAAWVALEGDRSDINQLLTQRLPLTSRASRLFKIDGVGTATELVGTVVRPNVEYLWVGPEGPGSSADWITIQPSAVQGAAVYRLRVPRQPTRHDLDVLTSCGLQLGQVVRIRPAGAVADAWTGEGYAEWLLGEHVLLAIDLGGQLVRGTFRIADRVITLQAATESSHAYVSITGLSVGEHLATVQITVGARTLEEEFVVGVRNPLASGSSNNWLHAISLESDPMHPSIEELFGGAASLLIHGPIGMDAILDVSFRIGREHRQLRHTSLQLPVTGAGWSKVLARVRKDGQFEDMFQLADSVTVRVSQVNLGIAELTATRDFAPLRFVRRKRGGAVRLAAHTAHSPVVTRYDFARPDAGIDESGQTEWMPGASASLLVAISEGNVAHTVVSPAPSLLLPGRSQARPWVVRGRRSAEEVSRLLEVAFQWGAAETPPDWFGRAQRRDVLRALTREIVTLLAGTRAWIAIEHDYQAHFDEITWRREIAGGPRHEQFARRVAGRVPLWPRMTVAERVDDLTRSANDAGVLDRETADLLCPAALRIASAPHEMVGLTPAEIRLVVEGLMADPVVLRAARFGVMLVDAEVEDEWTVHGGWRWN